MDTKTARRRLPGWAKMAILLMVLLAAGLWLITGLLADLATRVPPTSRPSFQPGLLHIDAERVRFRSLDGLSLVAWWMDAPGNGKPVVVILHGFGASKEHMLNYLLLAHQAGCPALAIDFRGHGESDPSLTSLGYHEQKDAAAAVAWVRQRRPGSPVVLWGTSMGAVTALHTAAHHPEGISGVIADAPFDSLHHTMVRHADLFFGLPEFPLLTLTEPRIEARAGFRIRDVDTVEALKLVRVPVLFIAGENDVRMPVALVRSLHDGYRGPKAWYVIPGTGHEYRPFEKEFQEIVTGFLLRPPADP
ncbi:MAG: alpha/beta fold hydrolase [Candidatus Methylacidiphilales bacterium]|nr:alpha/beta fold hydrolase [Candidatus Methylacidiphilales bacterium]